MSAPSLLCNPGLCFCWESSIVELLWGGMLSCCRQIREHAEPSKELWGCSEGVCLTPPMTVKELLQEPKAMIQSFLPLELSQQQAVLHFGCEDRMASGLGEGEIFLGCTYFTYK